PQHRKEFFRAGLDLSQTYQYDGRFMYAALCSLDRFPIGAPVEAKAFERYQPGYYRVRATVPRDWSHIGLLPLPNESGEGWTFPRDAGATFETWCAEPELTLAEQNGWRIEFINGWTFEKGRPLATWAKKIVEMRERQTNEHARAALREMLNHAI